MVFSFKDVLSHIEQTLIDSIRELKKSKKAIRTETALYLFGLSLSSFFEDNVSDVNINDKGTQARLLDSFRLGWKDGITGGMQSQGQIPQATPMETPIGTAPEQMGGMEMPGGAPAGPDQLGNLPMPGGTPPPAGQTNLTGGEPPDLTNPEEEPPQNVKQEKKFTFGMLRGNFLNEGKFNGVKFKL